MRGQARPGLACSENQRDKTVHLSQGYLMLCMACERFRFPEIFVQRQPAASKTDEISVKKETSNTLVQRVGITSHTDCAAPSLTSISDSQSGASRKALRSMIGLTERRQMSFPMNFYRISTSSATVHRLKC